VPGSGWGVDQGSYLTTEPERRAEAEEPSGSVVSCAVGDYWSNAAWETAAASADEKRQNEAVQKQQAASGINTLPVLTVDAADLLIPCALGGVGNRPVALQSQLCLG
jgi:hypothetical protein